jgi:hypothetical protein
MLIRDAASRREVIVVSANIIAKSIARERE